ncbi:MAG: MNIO family bufferin maturase [Candidatus Polarisedimenticolia bacterium]
MSTTPPRSPAPLGHGVGLRRDHFERILSGPTRIDWFEAISENFMVAGGRPLEVLTRVRERYPVVLHGVSLSIGSTDPLDEAYLDRLDALVRRFEPAWVSDHLCWTSVGGHHAHDLLPLPYTEEALAHVVARVGRVQDRLGRPIALENVSSYVAYRQSSMPEWEFLAETARRSGCGILLDVNNIYVSARNHGFDARAYLAGIPPGPVWQFHLAGHSDKGRYLLDTHDHPVIDPVWVLYREAVRRFGPVSTLIEWDDRIPPFERLEEESERARSIAAAVLPAAKGTASGTAAGATTGAGAGA